MKKSIFMANVIFSMSLVLAGPVQGAQQLLTGLGQIIMLILRFLSDTILNINSINQFLFAKILLFILILLIVYTVIKKNGVFGGRNNKPIHWIISISVSILAVKYLPNNFIQAILIQYGALAIGLTVFLPLAIYFFFIHQSGVGPFGRRIGWIVFATAFFALWSFRSSELGSANYIYWVAIGFILFSIMFDKSIHKYFGLSDFKKFQDKHREKMKRNIMRDFRVLDEDFAKGIINRETYNREAHELKESMKALSN